MFIAQSYRLIVEIRFKPTLDYLNNMRSIATAFEERFDDWRIKHDPAEILFVRKEKDEAVKIELHSIGWRSEGKDPFKAMPQNIQEVIKLFVEDAGIKIIERVGVRSAVFYPQDGKYFQLVNRFSQSFNKEHEALVNLSADKVRDLIFVMDGIKNGYNNHIEFGPVTKDQIGNIFSAEATHNESDTNILIDVDVFMTDPDLIELESNIVPLINENRRLIDGYSSLIEKSL